MDFTISFTWRAGVPVPLIEAIEVITADDQDAAIAQLKTTYAAGGKWVLWITSITPAS